MSAGGVSHGDLSRKIQACLSTLQGVVNRLKAFRDDLPKMVEDVVASKEDDIVSAVADDQLYRKGIDGREVEIMSYAPYAPRTIAKKRRKGQPTNRVTLRDTGRFHRGMKLVFSDDGFYVTSDDSKTEKLKTKYGDAILMPTHQNLKLILRDPIRKEFIKRLKGIIYARK